MTEATIHTPIGWLLLREEDGALCALSAVNGPCAEAPEESALLCEAKAQLQAYFAGERRAFDLPIAPRGTAFETAVWRALEAIPYGQTRTYGEIAAQIGKPGASRAVGRACGRNPILLVVPCHRVIGSGGRLTGFAAGLDTKRALLALEGVHIDK